DRLPADRRGGDAVAQRRARARGGRARARDPVPPLSLPARAARADRGRAGGARRRRADAAPLLLGRPALTAPDERRLRERALPGLQLRAAGAALGPAVRARAEHVLRLLRVRHRQDELGAALLLRRAAGRDGARRHCALRGLHLLGVLPPARGTRARAGAGRGAGPARGACAAARLGLHRRAGRDARRQRLLPDDAVLLLLRVRRARARDPCRLRADGVKVVVLTTSYPSPEHPVAGSFVASAVRAARDAGIDVTVVSPAEVRHFGVAYGGGIAQNLRAAPWKLALVPGFLAAYALAARRAAAGADLVHAHWIPTALAARATGKPYVLQVWGTDVELARRAPALARPLLRGARLVVAASQFLAGAARELGAREVAVVPAPVPIPAAVGPPDEPPHVLYAGRLSEEKGILEFLEATAGLPRVVVGDGPLRGRVPEAAGFVPPAELGAYYERAAVVCVPSRREGYGMTAREAMAHGRPVVATAVGGLADLRGDGVVLVPPGDVGELRAALRRLLADEGERRRLGAAARRAAEAGFSPSAIGGGLAAVYRAALG